MELGYQLSYLESENLLKKLDADGSGRVDFEEFMTHIASHQEQADTQGQF